MDLPTLRWPISEEQQKQDPTGTTELKTTGGLFACRSRKKNLKIAVYRSKVCVMHPGASTMGHTGSDSL